MDGGMRALVDIAALSNRPTAAVCSNDMTAIGVMREAYNCGISVLDELLSGSMIFAYRSS